MRTFARTAPAHRRTPGRLGQRPPARALHAALLADGPLRRRPAAPRRRAQAAPGGRVLGARAGVHARRAVAGHAAPDGRPTAQQARQVGVRRRPAATSTSSVLEEIRDRGPSTARDLDDGLPRSKKHWGWNWSETRKALDYLFVVGEVAIAGRNSQFEVLYDLPERVIPADVLALPTPSVEEAQPRAGAARRRVARGRHRAGPARLLPDAGEGDAPRPWPSWSRRASSSRSRSRAGRGRRTCTATRGCPAGSEARALLSPFDPLVWERDRTEALFDFHYRIEIYVPAAEADPRLLRAAVPARRAHRRPGRPQGRPPDRAPAREGRLRRAGSSLGDRPTSWPPSCVAWPAGSVSTPWWSSPEATWPRLCRCWSEVACGRLGRPVRQDVGSARWSASGKS